MMKNPEMMSQAMNMLKSNPEMLKSMSGMLGKDHPMAKYLENSSPKDLEKMMKWMSRLTGCFRYVMLYYNFIKAYMNIILIVVIAWLIYNYVL